MHFTLSNKVSFADNTETILGLIMINCPLLVDGWVLKSTFPRYLLMSVFFRFFVISGYLGASSLLREHSGEIKGNDFLQNAKLYGRLLVHRYMRLTPVLIISMLMSDICSALLEDISVFRLHVRDDLICPRYEFIVLLLFHFSVDHKKIQILVAQSSPRSSFISPKWVVPNMVMVDRVRYAIFCTYDFISHDLY